MTADAQAKENQVPEFKDQSNEVRTLAKWVTLVVSVAILGGVFIMVTFLYVVDDGDPIMIRTEAQLDQIRISGDTHYVSVVVSNEGDVAAGNVQIQAKLRIGEETEISEFTIVTLSGNDSETGVIAFSGDPRDGEFTFRVASYIE